jgi:hypothetical protein
MSQFEDDRDSFTDEYFVKQIESLAFRKIERQRAIGYAEYNKFSNRFKRFVKKITGRKYISFEQWKTIVDKHLEVNARR